MARQFGWAVLVASLVICGCRTTPEQKFEEVEVTDHHAPELGDDGLEADRLDQKTTHFDPDLVDPRPLNGWQVNQSEAVISLDSPLIKPDIEPKLLELYPSYAAAMAAGTQPTLLSVNLLDGKAKQFDDGLYAAVDLAYFNGIPGQLMGHQELVQRLLDIVGPDQPASAYLAAGLTLGGRSTTVNDRRAVDEWIDQFERDPVRSKPISFYTWNESLQRCWKFMRFFQHPFNPDDGQHQAVVQGLKNAFQSDESLAADYQRANHFFAKLTNPLTHPTLVDPGEPGSTEIAFFPASTSRETRLFAKLFPFGVPSNVNLMREFIKAIRSGTVDLAPTPESGWYEYQVYPLEVMLLPERGEEHHKLLLTKPYKQRMQAAFAALMTKRRETHARQLGIGRTLAAAHQQVEPLVQIAPRLRIEPCPSYYLRTARSYSFLAQFLEASLGPSTLQSIMPLRQSREQNIDLAQALDEQRQRFYGLYLLSCEDIGLKPSLLDDEVADPAECQRFAAHWLEHEALQDRDLAEDTRVAVPIFQDGNKSRLWVTLGVRLAMLEAAYARPPRLRLMHSTGEWTIPKNEQLQSAHYLIAVDEFAEVEIPTHSLPNREELRKLCNQYKTKDKIINALKAAR